jgi:hypothetical protein
MSTPIQLTQLGDPNAVVCDGDSCALPAASGSQTQADSSGSVISATTAPNADSSEFASTKAL